MAETASTRKLKWALEDRLNAALSKIAGRPVRLMSCERLRRDDLEDLVAILEAAAK